MKPQNSNSARIKRLNLTCNSFLPFLAGTYDQLNNGRYIKNE